MHSSLVKQSKSNGLYARYGKSGFFKEFISLRVMNSIPSPHWCLTCDSIVPARTQRVATISSEHKCFMSIVNIFSNDLLYSMLEFPTRTQMPVRGRKHLDRKRKVVIALHVKVPEAIGIQCCGKWCQDWRFSFAKDHRQLSQLLWKKDLQDCPEIWLMPFPRLLSRLMPT